MRKKIEIDVRGMDMRVEIEVGLEDQGIGHWECHGSGYHEDIVVVSDDVVYSIEMDDYARVDKIHTFEYEKLNKRNQGAIDEAIIKVLDNMSEWDLRSEMMEDAI